MPWLEDIPTTESNDLVFVSIVLVSNPWRNVPTEQEIFTPLLFSFSLFQTRWRSWWSGPAGWLCGRSGWPFTTSKPSRAKLKWRSRRWRTRVSRKWPRTTGIGMFDFTISSRRCKISINNWPTAESVNCFHFNDFFWKKPGTSHGESCLGLETDFFQYYFFQCRSFYENSSIFQEFMRRCPSYTYWTGIFEKFWKLKFRTKWSPNVNISSGFNFINHRKR